MGTPKNLPEKNLIKVRHKKAEFYQLNMEEIDSVQKLSTKLFPCDIIIDQDTTNKFRSMIILSRTKIPSTENISSHRAIIGPVIVAMKRIFNKLVANQLRPTIDSIQVCFGVLIAHNASLHTEIIRLKSRSLPPKV